MGQRERPPLVVHIIHALGTGGLENGLVNIINRMPVDRYRHAIVCLTRSGEFARRITVPDVQIIELKKKPGHDLGLYVRMWRLLRRLKPAIVHTRNLAALEMNLVARLVPGVCRIHGEHGRDIYDVDGSNKKYIVFRRLLNPFVQRFVAVSADIAQWLTCPVGIPAHKVEQIYNGVDSESFHPGAESLSDVLPHDFSPSSGVIVGTVGRLAEIKNQSFLVESFARLLTEQPRWRDSLRLVLIGDGPERNAIEQLIRSLDLDGLVWMAGDRADIPALLRAMDIFVLPSLGEGISNTILEAMATGLPVIATDVGGNPELIEHGENGLLVAVNDQAALANGIALLAAQVETRRAMGTRGLEKVAENFDWTRTVNRYMELYDQLLTPGVLRHRPTSTGI